MGLFDVFDKDKRRKAAIEKNIKRVQQVYGQAESRQKAILTLKEDGSDDAIYGLLMRYTVRVEPSITDQEEKEWVLEILTEFGAGTLPVIERFLERRDAVTWPLRAVEEIGGADAAAAMVERLLRKMAGQYHREHTKKITLIKHLARLGRKDDAAVDAVAAFLDDMDQDTVVAALDALQALDETGRSREPMLEVLKEKGEDSARLKTLILEVFAAKDWTVKGYRPTVEALLEEPWHLTSDGQVRRRGD